MKRLAYLSVLSWYMIALMSCSTDSPVESENPVISERNSGNESITESNYFFGFLDGDGSSSTYLDMPIESSTTHLFIGRWMITKLGIDENNNGNIIYFEYENFKHKDCGTSFLQFNNDGSVFENSYYNDGGTCILYSEADTWELIDKDRFRIYVYDNIYLVSVSETELVLKYDWAFENSLYGPSQIYYHYKRIDKLD